jgi:hypothetical protein
MTLLKSTPIGALAAAALLFASPAFAETLNYEAQMRGTKEVPHNSASGVGIVKATFDTTSMVLDYTVVYYGLTGPVTAAHFHGPAPEGENAPPVVPVEGDLSTPFSGTATLDATQAEQLQAGNWYFNLHTDQFPDGEIRGQLAEPRPYAIPTS